MYDLELKEWIQVNYDGEIPQARNGHSIISHNGKLVLFGGIIEITKESDEVFIFDPNTNEWSFYDALTN